MKLIVSLITSVVLGISTSAQEKLASTPPMGWNSWQSYARTINEAQLRANAERMAKELKPFGWQYVVMDKGWYVQNPEANEKDYMLTLSDDGRFLPALNRFPSATNGAGLKPLANYIHSLGLKFGVHIIRGILRARGAPRTVRHPFYEGLNQSLKQRGLDFFLPASR